MKKTAEEMIVAYRWFVLPILFFILTNSLAGRLVYAQEMSVDQLLDYHQKTLSRLNKLRIKYSERKGEAVSNSIWEYSPTGEILQSVAANDDTGPATRSPTYFYGEDKIVYSTLATEKEWSSFAPKSLAESLDSGLNFTKEDDLFRWDLISPKTRFLFSFIMQSDSLKLVSLTEYVKSHAWVSAPKSSLNDRGEPLWAVYMSDEPLSEENMSLDNLEKGFVKLEFNEAKNYLVESIITFIPSSSSPGVSQDDQAPVPLVLTDVVSQYYDLADGISFPKQIISGLGTPGMYKKQPLTGTICDVHEIAVNNEVTPRTIKIPEYAKVFRNDLLPDPASQSGQDGFAPVSFWGGDNSPAITFVSASEYDEYVDNEYHARHSLPKAPYFSLGRILLLCLGVAMVVASVVLKKFRVIQQ
ncbi:MAG: hypothetical protein Q4G68_03810 [Planctomycetia bacterium]|nr:hypothetical protein [Planctomycetia bacterium]